ncbi:MAG: hypothetical protein KHY83_00400 [Coriobacteriia bacterium]|nr:hypothetical protein [Coriobacteriia bacterium]MBS5477114.1 hypothetical protein [Coriobacteriia bacterium]
MADWKHAGLSKPSTVRCSKTVEVAIEDVAVAELMGTLSPSDAELVRQGLLAAGKLEEVL